ncbi:MAG: hypothetical protein IKV61_01905 [Clostridia bacterium]|nr:hypothetical protein [Clostridia bacterium]
MKKVVIKSTIITVLIIILFSVAFTFIVTAFFPKYVADVSFKLGNKQTCVNYSEKQYNKTLERDDLSTLVERSIWAGNNAYTIKYGAILINSENFSTYCNLKDEGYLYYVVGSYVKALYESGEKQKSAETAFLNTSTYSETNPIRVVASLAIEENNKDIVSLICTNLQNRNDSNEQIIQSDVALLQSFLNS